jgi:hypothetical protein
MPVGKFPTMPKEEILDIFNLKAFVFWDKDHPKKALERIQYLEENWTTCEQVLQQPVLVPGAVEKYFLLDDNFGGGILKAQIC